AGVGLTTGSTADVLPSAGSVGVAAGGADSVPRVPAPDSPASSPVASPTTEGERPQIMSISQRLLALADRVSLLCPSAPAAGDAAEAPSVPSSLGVTVGSGVLDVSPAPQDATETLASPTNEAEQPPASERILALADRLWKFHAVLAGAAGDAGETSRARSVLGVTVGSGDLVVSLSPREVTETVTRGAPEDMEGRDDGGPGVEMTSQMSGETPVVEATVASGGLVLEVDGAQLEMVEENKGETAGRSRETVPDERARPVSWVETAETAENPIAAAEKAEEGSILPAVESGLAAGETVVVTPGTLTIKTRKVSSEERQMAGAPQGEMFDVVALKSSEVPTSVDVSKDLEAVQATLRVNDWASLFAAVSSARTLLLHHRDVFGAEDGGPGLVARLVSLVADTVSNRRSVVQTNGLRCLGEMFSCVVGIGMTADQMGTLVRSTLSCHKSSSKFCGEEAKK
ncbi:unnamed protein product, partial [Ectocarpus sp. 13 AM-2016]